MSEFATTPPIPYVNIGDQAVAVRSAINVYSKLETYSQVEVDDLFFASGIIPDPDAAAYITTVQTALGTTIEAALPSAVNPKRLIYNFIKAEKAAGRWTAHKRIYLPVYNNSAASAIDLISRASGSFQNTWTHAAGYVQGDGTSGHFRTGFIPSSGLVNPQNASIGWLAINAATTGTRSHFGAQVSPTQSLTSLCVSGTSLRFDCGDNSTSPVTLSVANQIGIVIATSFAGRVRQEQRRASGFSTLIDSAFVPGGTLPNIEMYGAARNLTGAAALQSDARYGSWFANTGMSAANAIDFTLNLKNLYEGLTGIALP